MAVAEVSPVRDIEAMGDLDAIGGREQGEAEEERAARRGVPRRERIADRGVEPHVVGVEHEPAPELRPIRGEVRRPRAPDVIVGRVRVDVDLVEGGAAESVEVGGGHDDVTAVCAHREADVDRRVADVFPGRSVGAGSVVPGIAPGGRRGGLGEEVVGEPSRSFEVRGVARGAASAAWSLPIAVIMFSGTGAPAGAMNDASAGRM
jgi:hypothetical protein